MKLDADTHERNVTLQWLHSDQGYGREVREGAMQRAHDAIHLLRGLWPADGALGNILVIGPHHECELHAFSWTGSFVLGLDIVPAFVERINAAPADGVAACVGAAEDLPRCLPGGSLPERGPSRYNVYSSHALEHCYDRKRAFKGIRCVADRWVYLVLPIELRPTTNESHLSQFWSIKEVRDEFPNEGWTCHWEQFRWSEDGWGGEYRVLFIRK